MEVHHVDALHRSIHRFQGIADLGGGAATGDVDHVPFLHQPGGTGNDAGPFPVTGADEEPRGHNPSSAPRLLRLRGRFDARLRFAL